MPGDVASHGSLFMDEPAPLTPEPGAPLPLTPLKKWIFGAMLVLGIVPIGLAVVLLDSNLPPFVIGGFAGAGGSMMIIGAFALFHRPGR
jgi:hypothetical protein